MVREKTIERYIKGFIAKQMSIDPDTITRETILVNDLNAGSVEVVNVVIAIESKFKITFPTESSYVNYTLQYLIDGTKMALANKPAASRLRRKKSADKPVETPES